jgi:uncharacterized protein
MTPSRQAFRAAFGATGPAVLPVIHVLSFEQASSNLRHVVEAGAPGAFLINHDFGRDAFMPILRQVRSAWPDLWLGVNFLAEDGRVGFPVLAGLASEGLTYQALWADDACLDERQLAQPLADAITAARENSAWHGAYFGGVAFKKQRPVAAADWGAAARLAARHVDVPTTSGVATGHAADGAKIQTFRQALADRPLALASGVTPENAGDYVNDVDALLVATGINHRGDFYNIDPARLSALLTLCRNAGAAE